MNVPVSAEPSQTNTPLAHLHHLDTLRGIAIIAVFLHHALGASYGQHHLDWNGLFSGVSSPPRSFLALAPLTYGNLGVAMFFVVSGFCIHLSHARSKEASFNTFFVRRFFRIFPPYLAALLILFFKSAQSNHPASLADFLSHALLLHNYSSQFFFGINPSFWSIAVEAQLYVLYPLLWLYAQKRGWSQALWLTGALELGLRLTAALFPTLFPGQALPLWVEASPISYWFSWCLGAALANEYLTHKVSVVRRRTLYLLGFAVMISGLVRPFAIFGFPLAALLTVALIRRAVYTPEPTTWLVRSIARTGVISYSLYLIHQPVLALIPSLLTRALPDFRQPFFTFVICCLSFVVVYPLAVLFYRFVEMPSIAAGKVFIAKFLGAKFIRPVKTG